MKTTLEWRNYSYFPYERRFALEEVRKLFGCDHVEEDSEGVHIDASSASVDAALRLTYFGRVTMPDGTKHIPLQARLEATALSGRGQRQATRYSAHGLHEYKGKFNPQVVRAIGNRLGVDRGSRVLDPFSGSGTTLLECAHAGWNAVGVDRNPLAVMIGNAKVRALHLSDGRLSALVRGVATRARAWIPRLETGAPSSSEIASMLGARWREELPGDEYLQSWFPEPVLAQVAVLRRALAEVVNSARDRAVFEVVISDQLRDCSLQEPADLRIRRRKAPDSNYPLLSRALAALEEASDRVTRARQVIGEVNGEQRAILGDVRGDISALPGVGESSFDAVICSPPYATALPYIDTQRLSLVMFGLIEPSELRSTEADLVGARDIGLAERRDLENEIENFSGTGLPGSVIALCREMLVAAREPGNGFRRRNTPALVYRYFRDMASFFRAILPVLRPGAPAALVVGANRTTLAGREFRIDTPRLLADVAAANGFEDAACHVMETYQRYDMHQKNSISNEMLVLARRPAAAVVAWRARLRNGEPGDVSELVVRDEAVALERPVRRKGLEHEPLGHLDAPHAGDEERGVADPVRPSVEAPPRRVWSASRSSTEYSGEQGPVATSPSLGSSSDLHRLVDRQRLT